MSKNDKDIFEPGSVTYVSRTKDDHDKWIDEFKTSSAKGETRDTVELTAKKKI